MVDGADHCDEVSVSFGHNCKRMAMALCAKTTGVGQKGSPSASEQDIGGKDKKEKMKKCQEPFA
jgi:hypothetical protein